ncbi:MULTISPECIES: APC family permease [Metallosphaera]|uniref:APC family permease n=1 Tax=Metallosphaera TaxID=41980 RepID=UPI001F066584|nr:APC family permease [Metallosphaera sedula]MCH1771150.1 APC family permease [Metallosphaera sedula]MCP6729522.1 APC family permease [Metallosphaera sedula]
MEEKKTLFLRESSGLVREVSPWSSMFATFGLVTGGVPILILTWLFTAPGANWPMAFLLTLPPTLGMAYLFYLAGVAMPRAGGDYVFNSRAVHPLVGFVNYFGLFIGFGLSLGYYSYLGAQWFGYLFSGLGLAYNNQEFLNLGNWFSGTQGSIVVGLIIVIISAILASVPRAQWRFVTGAGIITFLSTIIMFVALAQINPSSFAHALSATTGIPNAYNQVISDATSNGLKFESPLYATFLAAPVIWYYYTWYNLPLSWAGEMKQVRKNVLYATVVAILIIAVYYTTFTFLNLHAFGSNFLTSWSYISNQGVNDTVYSNLQSIGDFTPFFAFIVTHSLPLFLIMFLALWLPNFYSNPPLVTGLVRYLFSWSFDRIMPEWMADVNETLRAPVKATLLVGAMGVIGLFLYAYNTPVSLVDVTVVFEIGYGVFALSTALMPYVRKNVYEGTFPNKTKVAGIPLVTIVGSLIFAFTLFLLAYTWNNPVLLPINLETILSLVIIYGLGIAIYMISSLRAKKKGLDINILFQEIPPE